MTLSDPKTMAAGWASDPLLSKRPTLQAPRFLRSPWDEPSSEAFGPWRISHKPDPAQDQTIPDAIVSQAGPGTEATEPEGLDDALAQIGPVSEGPAVVAQLDPEALKALEAAAYAKGLQAGRELEQKAHKTQREQERELIRNLGIELRSLRQNPDRFFEPLKKLAMHLAEILVRNELQTSEKAIQALIEACIGQLDSLGEPVTVSLNPQDLQLLRASGHGLSDQLQLVEDPNLRPGSVRAAIQDTMVQDLIEQRLEPLARKILADPQAWLQRSTLLHDVVDALPDDSPPRMWQEGGDDVTDVPDQPESTP